MSYTLQISEAQRVLLVSALRTMSPAVAATIPTLAAGDADELDGLENLAQMLTQVVIDEADQPGIVHGLNV